MQQPGSDIFIFLQVSIGDMLGGQRRGEDKTREIQATRGNTKTRQKDSDIPVPRRQFTAGMDIEFAVDILDMRIQGFRGNKNGTGNFFITKSFNQ